MFDPVSLCAGILLGSSAMLIFVANDFKKPKKEYPLGVKKAKLSEKILTRDEPSSKSKATTTLPQINITFDSE